MIAREWALLNKECSINVTKAKLTQPPVSFSMMLALF